MTTLTPVRPGFWNVPLWAEIGIYIVGIAAVVACIIGIVHALRLRSAGLDPSKAPCTEDPKDRNSRIKHALFSSIGQTRVMRGASGKSHFVLFWTFLLLFCGTATATLDWDIGHYIFGKQFLTGRVYLAYKLILDCAGLAALLSLAFFAVRRFVAQDTRVEANGRFATIIASLAAIIASGFLVEALRLAVQQPAWAVYSPVGNLIAQCFAGTDEATLRTYHVFAWVLHGLGSLTFVAAIPLTYYAHIFKTPISIYHSKTAAVGAIPKIEDIEEQETFGISSFDQFTDADRARFDGCTECGRCRGVCPAVKSGATLDPKALILSLKARTFARNDEQPLIDGTVSKEALWDCTTCGACAAVCPAEIPIPDLIVSMRRHMALEQGEFPEGLAGALENAGSVGNPWGMDPGSRLAWAKDLDVVVAKPGVHYDVLYWVGCSASYDRRAQKIARAMISIFKTAGVNYAVMQEERCHADFGRRAGEEYLFQTAAAENIENFHKYDFGQIVAACPHCFNTLKTEYPQFEGGAFTVTAHSAFISQLISEGKLSLTNKDGSVVTFHDACYLARYNKDTTSARNVLMSAGMKISEAAAHGANATCCGAGGAQIFMDRASRTNVIRLKELKATGAGEVVVSCPHCMTMLTSAQAQENNEADNVLITDIAEVVAARLTSHE